MLACRGTRCQIEVDRPLPIRLADGDGIAHDRCRRRCCAGCRCGRIARRLCPRRARRRWRSGIRDDGLAAPALAQDDGARLFDGLSVDVCRRSHTRLRGRTARPRPCRCPSPDLRGAGADDERNLVAAVGPRSLASLPQRTGCGAAGDPSPCRVQPLRAQASEPAERRGLLQPDRRLPPG